ncbi:MAG: AAA family ATPase [Candidatus Gastranaerophilales bacterium]|nr:AAA family ATPase [Candidatus Gastranaerophilales bacterium]
MFKYIKLKNFKSLIDVKVDFTAKANKPKKVVLMYGENGSGKTNLISAFSALYETTLTRSALNDKSILLEKINEERKKGNLLNFPKDFLEDNFKDIASIIQKYKTVNSKGNILLEFGFRYKNKDGVYKIELGNEKIISESLSSILNKNTTEFFSITSKGIKVNENIFKNSEYYKEFINTIEQYKGNHSVLSLLFYDIRTKAKDYVKKRIISNFYDIYIMFTKISLYVNQRIWNSHGILSVKHKLLGALEAGEIKTEEKDKLLKMENFVNYFFTNTYSDIKGAYYQIDNIDNNKIKYQLYFKKQIFGQLKDISLKDESTGTLKLLRMLPFIYTAYEGGVVIIDEFDSGIHDVLMKKIIECLCESINGQIILTTHNTSLLESDIIPKDSIYVFTLDMDANKKILPISVFEERIHPNLNIRKRYIKGLYGAIPIPMDVDFDDLSQELE